jgi:cytochrome c-type biogenesis protein CcmH/NrfG
MKYLFTVLLLICALPLAAQTAPQTGPEKDIRQQTQAELTKTALELEQALTLQPASVELHVKLGFTYTRLGRADAAQRAFEGAVKLDPRKAIAHYMLGLIYEKKGLKDKAAEAWRACLATAAEQKLKETAVKHLNNLNAR